MQGDCSHLSRVPWFDPCPNQACYQHTVVHIISVYQLKKYHVNICRSIHPCINITINVSVCFHIVVSILLYRYLREPQSSLPSSSYVHMDWEVLMQFRELWPGTGSRPPLARYRQQNTMKNSLNMMTSSNGNIFRVTGHLCGEFTGPRWIPRSKASNAELWCFLWSAPK